MTPAYRDGDLVAGRYRVTRFLGAGRVGEVFEVQDLQLWLEPMALKRVHAALAGDEAWQERLKRALSRARTVTHPSVCRIFDVSFDGEVPFWTMHRAAGETLAQRLARQGPPSRRARLSLVTQIAAALDAAHVAGLAHGGLSASSIFVVDGDRALVADLGVSPEVLREEVDLEAARALDIRALRALAAELGARPAAGEPRSAGDVARGLAAAARGRLLRFAAAIALAGLASLALLVVAARAHPVAGLVAEGCGRRGAARIELFTDRDAFVRALGSTRLVDFDDVDTRAPAPVRVAADRYRERGIVLDCAGGLFAHPGFGLSQPPGSLPNDCAVGPPPAPGQPAAFAPRTTDVAFRAEGRAACTAGFGLTFVAPDYATAGEPALSVYDGSGATLGSVSEFSSTQPKLFRGFIVRDGDGNLLPVLARARVGSGNQWPRDGTGGVAVLLDDLTFAPPVAPL